MTVGEGFEALGLDLEEIGHNHGVDEAETVDPEFREYAQVVEGVLEDDDPVAESVVQVA
jgi:hypothetical protein